MNSSSIILQNFPHCSEWTDQSFMGELHENSIINTQLYWPLEAAILDCTKTNCQHEISWPLFRIFSAFMSYIGPHFDPKNGFKIKYIDNRSLYEFIERFQMVFEGFFKGEAPDLDMAFDEKNPLLSQIKK